MATRFADFLHRYRWLLFGLWLLHAFFLHYYVLGFWSWDGFGHRGVPVVELAQHGDMATWKFNEWSLVGYTPFVELAHIPFLLVFGMRGFIIGFPLVVFPLCVMAVHAFVHELTGARRAATFGALAYVAIPMVNSQPFSAYIDFAVVGILAFFLFALLRVRSSNRPLRPYLVLALATFMFTMARSQGPYVVAVMFPMLGYALFCERTGRRIRIVARRQLGLAAAAIAVGALPAVALQIYKFVEYGSPIAPMQLSFMGLKIGKGVTLAEYFRFAGLGGDDLGSLVDGFYQGWIWADAWPVGSFSGSTHMAAGLLFVLALLLFPAFWRRSTRIERWVLLTGLVVSLLTRDFAVPRWGYTTVLAIVLVLGRALAGLAESRRAVALFWAACAVLFAHLLRPEFDYLQLDHDPKVAVSPRMNMTWTKHWKDSAWDVPAYPDRRDRYFVIEETGNHFLLHIYGRRLTNTILGTIPADLLGPRCANLAVTLAVFPDALFVDDLDHTKGCQRECTHGTWYCRSWRIAPGP